MVIVQCVVLGRLKMESEIDKEFDRIEKEMNECECGQGVNVELGKCNIHDVLYSKHEGMRFAVHQMLKEEIKWLQSVLDTKHIKEEDKWIIDGRISKVKERIKEYNFGGLIE